MVKNLRTPIAAGFALLFSPTLHSQVPAPDSVSADSARNKIFMGKLSVGGSATRSTVDVDKVTAEIVLDLELNPNDTGPRHQFSTAIVSGSYEGKKKGDAAAIIVRSYTGFFQHLVFVSGDQWFVSGNARFLHNNSLGVYLQQRYSALLGTRVSTRAGTLEVNAGPALIGQNFIGSQQSTRFVAAEIGESASIPLRFIRPNAILSETIRVALPLGSDDPLIGEADVLLLVPITNTFSVSLHAFNYHISNPPEGSEKNYLNGSVNISISVGN